MKFSVFLRLIRAEDYLKNCILFAPLFFAGKANHLELWPQLLVGFVAFCLISSSVYIFNDYNDKEFDQFHIIKCKRPQAAGEVNGFQAGSIGFIFLTLGEFLIWKLGGAAFWIFQLYIVQNILYTLILKRIILLDVLIISLGYVWRIYIGGVLAGVPITNWLYVMTILIMLTLSIGKRYTDINATRLTERVTVNRMYIPYTSGMLKICIGVILMLNLVVYVAYTIYPATTQRVGSDFYFLTALPVGIGLYRYSQQILGLKNSASPVRLLMQDKILIICVIIWLMLVAFFNYQLYV